MIKQFLSILIALAPVAQSAKAQAYKGNISFTPVAVAKQADSLRLQFSTVLDKVVLPRQASLLLTPRLVSADGQHSYTFQPILVGGRNRQIMWQRHEVKPAEAQMVRRHNGRQESISHTLTAPYLAWMRSARLLVDEKVQGCASCELGTQDYVLMSKLFREPYRPTFHTAYLTPEAEPVKVRADKFVARFNFRVNRSELLPNLGNNAFELKRVDSVANAILKNPDVQVKNVAIDGYASPEGNFKANATLSQNRALAFVKHMKQSYNLGTDLFSVQGHGEDWKGLEEALRNSDWNEKQTVLDIISNNPADVKRKQLLKELNGGATYARLLQEFYPALRRTEYQFTYQVRPFSIEEACVRIKTNPQLLSLNEMYLVANHYPVGSSDRQLALDKAAQFYPNSPVSRFNLMAARLAEGKALPTDAPYLNNYTNSPQQLNNLGVAHALSGNLEQAKACFQKAAQLPEAKHNLAEIQKLEAEK